MKVTFINGIASMSGTMNCGRQGRVVFTHRKNDKPGQGRAYFRTKDSYKRSTKVSERELKNREIFARTNEKFSQLTPKEKNWFARKFQDCHGVFNGKKYATLQGFTKARLYDEVKNGILD